MPSPLESLREVHFWRCANERAQAQGVAADIERLLAGKGVQPRRIAVLVASLRADTPPVARAFEERAIPYAMPGSRSFFERVEVRDVLAWMRLLIDPRDASAVVRALARPPIELRQVDLARLIQIARRRKLDMISALTAATESPQVPPEARERIVSFLELYREAASMLDTIRPDMFVHRLIERLGLRRQQLLAPHAELAERLLSLARLGELAVDFVGRLPQSTPRELAEHLVAISQAGLSDEDEDTLADCRSDAVWVMGISSPPRRELDHLYVLGLHRPTMLGARPHSGQPVPAVRADETPAPSPDVKHVAEIRRLLKLAVTCTPDRLVLAYPAASHDGAAQPPSQVIEDAREALAAEWEEHAEELFGPAETLHATLRMMREEVLGSVARLGGRLGELRLDTDMDVSHGVVRYLELVKLAALLERRAGQGVAEVLPDINARLLAAVTPLQREIFQTSTLDDALLSADHNDRARAQALAARDEPSLQSFLPRRGDGLALSASDIETYRSCPLRYKFARVLRIPSEPTVNQRFGIAVHQVLERYHSSGGQTLGQLIELLDVGWRRNGFGDGKSERQLREKARAALTRYHQRLQDQDAEPVWFERSFAFQLGPHHLRGRVDRVDRLANGEYELIDYKTSRPKTAAQLEDDVQLSLYALGARESWQLEAARRAYYYVLDDQKVPVPCAETDADGVRDTVLEVGESILAQRFEPTPSVATCSICDYRIVCPAAEK